MSRLARRFAREERGIALVLALGMMTALSISVTTVIYVSSSSSRTSTSSKGQQLAFSLAEAGINNAMAVLYKTGTNTLTQSLMPACTGNPETSWNLNGYEGGSVRWCGDLDLAQSVWYLTSVGIVTNPTSPAGTKDIRRKLTAQVPITPQPTKTNTVDAWNYMFATRTGTPSGCDLTFSNNVTISSDIYTMGNLCLDNNVIATSAEVIVNGRLQLGSGARIGSSTTRALVSVGGSSGNYCKYHTNHWHTMSNGDGHAFCGDSDYVYSKLEDGSPGVDSSPTSLVAPIPNWDYWYTNAVPGPRTGCTTTSGTPPVFDGNTARDNSVAGVFELAPTSSSYTCRVGPADAPTGQLSWNHTTKVLSVTGTIFIDGSIRIANTAVNTYTGFASIYISGTFLMDNGAKLCAQKNGDGTDCDYAGWDPNNRNILIIANGDGSLGGAQGQTGSTTDGGGNGIKLVNNSRFQGSLQATKAIQLQNNSRTDGPMIASTIVVDNNVQPDAFPNITTAPAGMPGNDAVFAQPNPPRFFSG